MAKNNEIKVTVVFATAGAQRNVKEFTGELREMEKKTGSATSATGKQFGDLHTSAKKFLGRAGMVGLVAGATGAVVLGFNRAIDKGSEFQQQLADLEAITGISGQALDNLSQAALDNSVKTGVAANQQIEAYKLLASNIDIASIGGVEGLKRLGRETVTLSQAAGVTLATAANTVAATMNQWSLAGEDSARVVNVLAAGSKEGAAEVDDLALSLKEAGTTAALAEQSLETTVAALEILGENALKGSQAGTGLRNTFTILNTSADKLAKHGIKDINLESDGLVETLRKLEPLLEDNAAMAEIFGRENLNAASILIANADAVAEMEEKITGTNTAQEQANIQTNTYKGAVARLSTAINAQLIPAFQENNGVMVQGINHLISWVEATGYAVRVINEWFDEFSDLNDRIDENNDLINKQVTGLVKHREEAKKNLEIAKEGSKQEAVNIQYLDNANKALFDKKQALITERDQIKLTLDFQKRRLERIKDEEQGLLKNTDRIEEAEHQYQALQIQYAGAEQALVTYDSALSTATATYQKANEAQTAKTKGNDDETDSISNLTDQLKGLKEEYNAIISSPDIDEIKMMEASRIKQMIIDLEAQLREIEKRIQSMVLKPESEDPKFEPGNFEAQVMADSLAMHDDLDAKRRKSHDEYMKAQDERTAKSKEVNVAEKSAWEGTAEAIGKAAAQQIMYAETGKEAIRGMIKAIVAEIVARAILNAFGSAPGPLALILAPIMAAGAVRLAGSLIPSFETGVDNFEGGVAKVHKDELITYLPRGANVITNENVRRMEQMSTRPDGIGGFRSDVRPVNVNVLGPGNRDVIEAIDRQTERLERVERRMEFNMTEFNRNYENWKRKEAGLT